MSIVYLGRNSSAWTQDSGALVGLSVPDARHHAYVIGKTGSGKSTLLRNLVLQHIQAGHGVALIDPHGDLATELLDHYPPSRADDLVYFDPSDQEYPVGLNPLFNVPKDQRALVTDGLVGAFKSIWFDSWGPRMEYILANTLAALLECQNTTLLGVNRMLADEQYRARIVRQIQDPQLRFFWEQEFARYDPRFLREAIAPIQNKLGQFTLHPAVRNILGQVATKLNFRYMMDTGRVFLANLSKGRLGAEKANLLGSLLVTQFQLAAMSRADVPEDQRRDFHLAIDEFHNFTTQSFATILAEARKYRLSLTLSHQYMDQLSLPVRQAVLGNVGTLLAFRVGYTDAAVLEHELGHAFVASQFADLDRYEVFLRLLQDGQIREPQRISSLPPLENWHGRRATLIRHSRNRYAQPRAKIEDRLRRWAESPAAERRD
ncbi:MAG: type IV secretion system DNA-binding domain-containing protein [Verrucomicrobiales bacterium]|nr:type IV secretion system DNA-binding domain-containing protein [Verrucomicrobiales bacterium]